MDSTIPILVANFVARMICAQTVTTLVGVIGENVVPLAGVQGIAKRRVVMYIPADNSN